MQNRFVKCTNVADLSTPIPKQLAGYHRPPICDICCCIRNKRCPEGQYSPRQNSRRVQVAGGRTAYANHVRGDMLKLEIYINLNKCKAYAPFVVFNFFII